MKIAFWGDAKGSCGVTSNLACISVASVMKYSYKAVLWENHSQKNNLENVLLFRRTHLYMKENVDYKLKPTGMSYIIDQLDYEDYIKTATNNKSIDNKTFIPLTSENKFIKDASFEILKESLYYIPAKPVFNKEVYDYDIYRNIKNILNTLDTFADITFIDTCNNNLSSKVILEEADLVVVNLIQNSDIIQYFFDNYSSILSKCVFLISRYKKQSNLNVNRISKLHSINKSQITTIPYNVEYHEAVSQGTIIEFLSRNYSCNRKNPNYEFVSQVKKAVSMIMEHISYLHKQEACL